jgi:hypothetical protein
MVRTNKIKGLSQAPIWQEPTMAPANDWNWPQILGFITCTNLARTNNGFNK